ncbi:unnamed protein product [Eruca vesicaria subsp. sativa]|uniref:Uncharacterized protein n=1 Tax=Eruca vesicaria subsp. sativa TaxID=29727 RepID=A0ABC8JFW6_ERUVS|nr:unnamed protein product [Eruca vesicaria subsp. sativa]
MECELEASPQVSFEASVEAKAYVRVMAASYVPSGCENTTSEAPLTINIPYSRLPEGIQEPTETPCRMNITFPVRLQKVSSPEMASEQKSKRWSVREDEELLAALKRCGQGNWTRIAQGEFSGKRTASQLSQRWLYIRRRCGVSTSASQSGQQKTETLAANHALSLPLGNRPPSKIMFSQGFHLVPSKKRRTIRGVLLKLIQQLLWHVWVAYRLLHLSQRSLLFLHRRSSPIKEFLPPVPTTVLPLNPTVETVSCYGGQREQAGGDGAISLVAIKPTSTNSEIGSRGKQAQSPLSRTIPVADTAVLGSTNQNLVDRTAVPSISGAGSQYNVKCEANNKVGSMVKVSNVCGESAEVATVGGTGQGV